MAKFFILYVTRDLVFHSFEADTREAARKEAIRYLTDEGLPVMSGGPSDRLILAEAVDGFNYTSRDLWEAHMLLFRRA